MLFNGLKTIEAVYWIKDDRDSLLD